MKHLLVGISILVLLLFPFQPLVVKAETTMQDYKDFNSFQKRYNEHLNDLLYYIGVSYDSNNHYFKENMSTFKNAVNETFDSSLINGALNAYETIMEKPITLLSVVSDLKNALLGKIKDYFTSEEVNPLLNGGTSGYLPEGYRYKLANGHLSAYVNMTAYTSCGDEGTLSVGFEGYHYGTVTYDCGYHSTVLELIEGGWSVSEFLLVNAFLNEPIDFEIIRISDNQVIPAYIGNGIPEIDNIYNSVVNNFNYASPFNSDYVPEVVPQLVCPDTTHDLEYTNGSFYTKARNAIVLSPDETVEFNGVMCNLDFKFPALDIDEQGNLISDGLSIMNPLAPTDDFDTSIIGYIRNSYDYATSVVNTGVNGLKSIINGTTGLITFTGSLFGFLPPEILTLFIGGFSIALGLWVFKK